MNLVDAIKQLGFQGSDEEAFETLNYIGLVTRGLTPDMTLEGVKRRVARDLSLAHVDLLNQLGSGAIEFTPEMSTALIGLALLNDAQPLPDVLNNLKTAALQNLTEEGDFFKT